jgi:glycosyltransferase involved in cell wall biosynthesis
MPFPFYIVLATYNRSKLLESTLASISRAEFPANYSGLIVVENGIKGNAEEIIYKMPENVKARYLYEKKSSKSAALNLAMESIEESAFVFFTDDDVKVAEDVFLKYNEAVTKMGKGFYYGGPVDADYDNHKPADWLLPYLPASAKGWNYNEKENKKLIYFLGCNWGAFCIDLKSNNGFSEEVGEGSKTRATGDETDMQKRLFESGVIPAYVNNAKVWHYVPRERCSLSWTLNRKYREGIYIGLNSNIEEVKFLKIYPVREMKEFFFSLISLIYSLIFKEKEENVYKLVQFFKKAGVISGLIQKKKKQRVSF